MPTKKKTKSLADNWTQREFAALLDVDQAIISRALSRGILSPHASCVTWIREFVRHSQAMAAGRGGDAELSLHDERARLAKAQTQKLTFEIKKSRNEFMAVAAVELAVNQIHIINRRRLLGLAHRVKSENASMPIRVHTSIDNVVHQCLAELGRERLPPEVLARIRELDDSAFAKEIEIPAEDSDAGPTEPSAVKGGAVGKRRRRQRDQKTQ